VYEFQLPEHMVREWVHNLNEWAKNNCVVTRNKTLPMLPNVQALRRLQAVRSSAMFDGLTASKPTAGLHRLGALSVRQAF